MSNDIFCTLTEAPRTPESAVVREVPPPLFYPSNSAGRGNDEIDLYWNGPIHHLFIPTLSSPRSSRDEDTADESSMESLGTGAVSLSLRPRLSSMLMPRVECQSSFLEITSISYPPAPKDGHLPYMAKSLNESYTTFESTWCKSEQSYRSPGPSQDEDDDDDDASLAYSLDDEASELTSEVNTSWHRPSPFRRKPSNVSEMDAWDCKGMIPKHIVVPEESWNPVLSSSGLTFKPL